jgi:phosphatidate cytidylyltransferase
MALIKSKLAMRLLTAGVLLPAALILAWVPALRPGFALFIAALAAIGLREYYAIVRHREIAPEAIGGIITGALIVAAGYWNDVLLTNGMLLLAIVVVSLLHLGRGSQTVAGLASSAYGLVYVGWFGAHLVMLHAEPGIGRGLVTLLFASVILTDSAAYCVGSLIGRHKMAPRISPNKSWEGAVAGLVAAVAGGGILWAVHTQGVAGFLPAWGLIAYLVAAGCISVGGQVGDLIESSLKRDAGVKDSGVFFPGHGGVLDRCDGFLFASPVLYYGAALLLL